MNLHHIAFETTDSCNLDCIYCYNIWKTEQSIHKPFNSYKKAIGTLRRLFSIAEIQTIAFTGGEPFLSERFSEVVLFCRMEGKHVTIISNGTQANFRQYLQLLKIGVELFEFPVHSFDEKIHDKMVQRSGSWSASVNSVRQVLAAGGTVVPVVVITRHNVNQLSETLDFIASLGCSRIMLNRYNIGGKGCHSPMEISATSNELRNAFALANEKAAEKNLRLTANVCSPVCLLHPDDYPLIGFGHCSSKVTDRPLTLDINGNIRLCNHSPVVAGNIYEKSLEDILFTEYTESWSNLIPEFCKSCLHWNICKGGCRAASEQCFGTLAIEDPIVRYI